MKSILVLIVFAHGEDTPGKRSPDGKFREYKWSREISKIIIEKLYSLGIKSLVVNPEDKDIKLSESCRRVNELIKKYKSQYDEFLVISPHVNAASGSGWHTARGFCAYVYTNASLKSRKFASIISDFAYNKYALRGNRSVPKIGYYTANFAILRGTNCPALLSENCFQDNVQDVAFLESEKGKEIISDLHVNSILEYINTL